MRKSPKTLSMTFCWVVAPLMWGVPALFAWLDWQAGAISDERFANRAGVGLLILPFVVVVPFLDAWKARQPKAPPVYRSTILD